MQDYMLIIILIYINIYTEYNPLVFFAFSSRLWTAVRDITVCM